MKTKRVFRRFTAVLLSVMLAASAPAFQLTSFAAETVDDVGAEAVDNVGAASGTTGDCVWSVDDNGVLTISGNGATGDYESSTPPWKNLQFTKAVIANAELQE
ncbi:MAG: hypothetical protein IIZ36_04120 [Ruminococcus sp.]|nr:hypothetical protein [Ruminococcus sp.]